MKIKSLLIIAAAFGAFSLNLAAENMFSGYFKDSQITSKVKTRLFNDKTINGFRISVTTTDGIVELKGKVAMTDEAMLAEKLARGVYRVKGVKNSLIIEPPLSGKSELKTKRTLFEKTIVDPSITAQVKTALVANQNINGLKVSVTTRNGVVFLEGTVPTDRQKNLAENIAKGTAGVKAVKNFLKVAD